VRSVPYEVVDVFTDRPFTGNPLAVVFDADGLGSDQMQALAREFHLSETVFLLKPTSPQATYRARIFTTERELPFAGHPSVGAAVTAGRRAGRGAGQVVQECGVGLLPITVYEDGRATLTGGPASIGEPLDPAPLLAAASLDAADFAGPAPRVASCGLPFPVLSVRPEAVSRAIADPAAARAAGQDHLYVIGWDATTSSAHVRMFAGQLSMEEDPATGSAALALGVWLVSSGLLPATGESRYTVRQGAEIHRPSTLECAITALDGAVESVTVTGHVVPVASGEILVPPFVG
jgi:trans-2,3-dihydro-3-hydroxyanthranilate isomerase